MVTIHECIHQNVHEFFWRELIHTASATVAFTLHLGVLHLAQEVIDAAVAITVRDAVLRSAKTEVHLKDGLKGTPVSMVLDERCSERILERFAIL